MNAVALLATNPDDINSCGLTIDYAYLRHFNYLE